MSNKGVTVVNKSGVSIAGLLGVAFVVLKLTGVITWSWWWVTAPFWGGIALALTLFLGGLAIALIAALIGGLILKIINK